MDHLGVRGIVKGKLRMKLAPCLTSVKRAFVHVDLSLPKSLDSTQRWFEPTQKYHWYARVKDGTLEDNCFHYSSHLEFKANLSMLVKIIPPPLQLRLISNWPN